MSGLPIDNGAPTFLGAVSIPIERNVMVCGDDLIERMERAAHQLLLAESDAGGRDEAEYLRLKAKREGVQLALGYVLEARRLAGAA